MDKKKEIRELRYKVRKANRLINNLDNEIHCLGEDLRDVEERVDQLEARIVKLESKDNDVPGIPDKVYNIETLKQFIKARFNEEALDYQTPSLKELCMDIRDELSETYLNIERVNDQESTHGYSAPDEKHADAIYLVGSDQIVDFCLDSSDPGVMWDRLTWSPTDTKPW